MLESLATRRTSRQGGCGDEKFIEIGVWRGGTGMLIARRMAMLGIGQPVYLCDTFTGVVKAGPHDPHYKGGEHADTSIAAVSELADRLSISNYRIVVGVFPEEAPSELITGPVAFCHIDVDAYDSAKDCFSSIWPRLTIGGIVIFDDYGASTTSGVTKFVEELAERPDLSFQYNLNGHATVIKIRA
jgi:O-methyltransferase